MKMIWKFTKEIWIQIFRLKFLLNRWSFTVHKYNLIDQQNFLHSIKYNLNLNL